MRTLGRLLGTAAAGAALVLLSPAGFTAHADAYNCPDFKYQEDAQEIYDQFPGDPYNLDGDHDGVACQDLPHRGTQHSSPPKTTSKPATTSKSATKTPAKSTTSSSGSGQVRVKPRGGVDTGDGSTVGDALANGGVVDSAGLRLATIGTVTTGLAPIGTPAATSTPDLAAITAGGAALAGVAAGTGVLLIRRRAHR